MTVRHEAADGVARIALDRPEVLSAFDIVHLRALSKALGEVAGDDAVNAIVIAGSGRAFSVGADIKAMEERRRRRRTRG